MKIMEWVKAHPYTTGALVIGGGVVFFAFSGWFSGGSSSDGLTVNQAGKTDAEVNAETALGIAQIQAQAQSGQTGASVEMAQIMAAVEAARNQTELQLGLANLNVQQNLGIATLDAQLGMSALQAQTYLGLGAQTTQQMLALIAANAPKKKQKGISTIIGQVYTGASVGTGYTSGLPSGGSTSSSGGGSTSSTGGSSGGSSFGSSGGASSSGNAV
jgi:hypothetical protein